MHSTLIIDLIHWNIFVLMLSLPGHLQLEHFSYNTHKLCKYIWIHYESQHLGFKFQLLMFMHLKGFATLSGAEMISKLQKLLFMWKSSCNHIQLFSVDKHLTITSG